LALRFRWKLSAKKFSHRKRKSKFSFFLFAALIQLSKKSFLNF
jgi:hypothetical protein